MKSIAIGLSSFVLIALTSCGSDDGNSNTRVAQPQLNLPSQNQNNILPISSTSLVAGEDTNKKKNPQGMLVQPNNTVPSNAAPSGAGLNPEHGKPGHRCELAVGAPLNSQPAAINATPATQATQQNIQPVSQTTVPQPIKTMLPSQPAKGTAGLNPAHGQPGHRCDIAEGAPLNSQAAQPSVTPVHPTNVTGTTVQPTPIKATPQNIVKPFNPATTPTTPAAGAAGMNPEHGKPGHRCDIAVGAPLDTKPKQ